MQDQFKEYLFNKNILVSEAGKEEPNKFEVLFSLANLFNIRISKGEDLVQKDMIGFVSEMLGQDVPAPFYTGFPKSVRELSADLLIFDQLLHYTKTYGLGIFSEAGHSFFEEKIQRVAFKEGCEIKKFEIVSEEEAVKLLGGYTDDLLKSSRPLNQKQYDLIRDMIVEYDHKVYACASKNTLIRLLLDLRKKELVSLLSLSDIMKVVDELVYIYYPDQKLNKLNLKNRDRKFIAGLLDIKLAEKNVRWRDCFEKKALWSGLLHHLHYKPRTRSGRVFVADMRGDKNNSVYARFEEYMASKYIRTAITILKEGKGSGAILRELDYIVSRIEDPEDMTYLLNELDSNNLIIMLQLYMKYSYAKRPGEVRTFRFVKHNMTKVYTETRHENSKRKSVISDGQTECLRKFVEDNIKRLLKNRLGKVYVDPAMKNIALPLQEGTSMGGYGVLSKGSRLSIPECKKIRAFTYWEKVDDIDLSVIALDEKGGQREFSWRTMAQNQSKAVTFSGDETSGYNGGSEYFDIDVEEFRKLYPMQRYLVFCNNVFSCIPFEACFCTAGYMLRDKLDSGEIYEPKTVQTSFKINCNSTFAYLFGIDLVDNEFIWLNLSRAGENTVAGTASLGFLLDYFETTKIMNVYSFFELMATEFVDDPLKADVVVSDSFVAEEGKENAREVIRSYDFEKMLALMNG